MTYWYYLNQAGVLGMKGLEKSAVRPGSGQDQARICGYKVDLRWT
jgi:hypothetical protein